MKRNPTLSTILGFAVFALLGALPAQAQFAANPAALTFPNVNNPSNPNLAFFTLTSNNPSSVAFTLNVQTLNGGTGWLAAVSTFGSTTTASIQVSVTTAGLGAGTYSGSVVVSSPTATFQQLSVPVTLQVGTSGTAITTSPTSLSFTYQSGQSVPLTQSLAAFTSISTNFTATATATTGFGWLSVTPASGGPSTSFSMSVIVSPSGLTNGTYNGYVTIAAAGTSQQVPVSLTVGQTSSGGLNPSSLSFNYTIGGSLPGSQTFTYTPPSAVSITAFPSTTTGTGWLTVSPSTTAVTTQAVFSVTVSPGALAAGTYTGNIVLIPSSGTQVSLPITLVVSPQGGGTGGVTVTPTSISATYTVGGFLSPQTLILSSSNSFTYNATAVMTTGSGWLTLTNNSGSGTSANISVGFQPFSLAPGTYSGYVSLSINGQAPSNIPVTLVVNSAGGGGGAVSLSPTAFSFNYTPGTALPVSQNLTMTAPASQTYSASVTLSSGFNWLTVAPSSGVTASTTFLSVSVSPAALAAGTYTGTITISVSGQPNVSANVTLLVQGSGTGGVSVNPASLSFSFVPGGNPPQSQSITLTTPSPATFTATANPLPTGSTWLAVGPIQSSTVTQPNGTSTAQLFVSIVNPGGLAIGTYTGTITLSTAQGNATVNVTLNVGTTVTTGSVSPTALSFNYQAGGAVPPGQLITVNTPGGNTSTFTATPTTFPTANWLAVTPLTGAAPGIFVVTVNPVNLPAASYSGNVSVLVGGTGTPVSVPISLTVSNTPVLRLNLNSTTFNYQIGGNVGAGQGQAIDLSSTGTALTVIMTTQVNTPAGGSWLSVSAQSASTPSTVTIGVNASGLSAGTYTGTVFFTAAGQPAISYPVTLNVSNTPLLIAGSLALNFNSPAGTGSPQPQNLSISVTGGQVAFQATTVTMNGGNWLSVTNSIAVTPGTVTVSVNQSGLGQDTYYGAIIINTSPQGQAANAPIVIPVVYTNGSSGGGGGSGPLTVSPATLTFTQVAGGAGPAAQSVSLTSSSFATFSATVTTQTGGQWLSVSPVTGTTPGSILVSANGSGLALGTYTGFVIVSTTGANPVQQVVPVTLNVITAPTMTATPTALTFDYQIGASAPGSQTIALSSSGTNIPYTATFVTASGGSWLAVTPLSGTTPSSLTVSVTPTNLPLGTYTGTVTIVSAATNSPQNIPVVFNVRQRTQVLSQMADGSTWKTTITLVNLDTVPAPFTLRFYGDDGNPLALSTDASAGRVTSIDGTLSVGGVRTISTSGTDSALSQGWVELSTTRLINGTGVFRQRAGADQEGGVQLTTSTNRFVMPFDNLDGFVTSMAILNANASQTVVVNLIMRDENGVQLATDTIVLAARAHQAFALPDRLPSTRARRGSVEFFTTGSDITGLGLRFNPTGAFTSFPVLPK